LRGAPIEVGDEDHEVVDSGKHMTIAGAADELID